MAWTTFGKKQIFLIVLVVLCGICGTGKAEALTPPQAATPTLLSFGVGMFNIFRIHPHPQFQVEYRSSYRFWKVCLPLAGFLITSKGSTYLFGGFAIDLRIGDNLAITPSIAAGLYAKGGGKNLHYPLEFRSSIECAYVFQNQSRFGIQLSHISNASLSSRNPGVESIMCTYSLPLCD